MRFQRIPTVGGQKNPHARPGVGVLLNGGAAQLGDHARVMREGHLAGELARADFSEAALMQLMAGVAAA